jgi:ribosome-associated protein
MHPKETPASPRSAPALSPALSPDLVEGASARPAQPRSPDEEERLRRFVVEAARLLRDLHCEDIVALDLRRLSDLADYILIASGTSDRQIKSLGRDIEKLARQHGLERVGSEMDGPSKWLVVDFLDVIVHLFEPVTRAYYDLETLWGDAPAVHWRRG